MTAAAAVAGASGVAPRGAKAADTPAPGAAGMPMGKIKDLEVSRMLLGGNLLTHYTHSRDLKYVYDLCKHYNTEEKILQTLAIAEQHGINTLNIHTVPWALDILKKHRHERGGKIQWVICTTTEFTDDMAEYRKSVRELADNGTEAIYVWGVRGDEMFNKNKMELVHKAVDAAKECGVPSGVGAHDLNVIIECEKRKIQPDFYIKTFHPHTYPSAPKPDEIKGAYNENPGYWCANPEETIRVMNDVEVPWIAFKIMAAGAIPPKEAFPYAFAGGADHLLVGMFDWEIAEDVQLLKDSYANVKDRKRPWRS